MDQPIKYVPRDVPSQISEGRIVAATNEISPDADIVAEARRWLGVRWRHQGRSREGVDCAGLVIQVAKATRRSTFDCTDYAREAVDEAMIEICSQHLIRIPMSSIRPGDVAVFRFEHQRHIAVIGDYLYGGLSTIHAYAPSRRVVEMRLDEAWRNRMMTAWRFPREAA